MRPRKFLLVTKALTTASLVAACKKENLPPPPANPKGSFAYEQDAGEQIPPPSNPKGSHYDAGSPLAPPTAPSTDAAVPHDSAGQLPKSTKK